MPPSPRPPLALTMGDPRGIGPEIAVKAWARLRRSGPAFALFADPGIVAKACTAEGMPAPRLAATPEQAADAFPQALPVIALEGSGRDGAAALAVSAIRAAVQAAAQGACSAVVTNPVSKAALYAEGFGFPGHTEFVAHLTQDRPVDGVRGPVMMLAAPELRVTLVTIHLPLKETLAALTPQAVIHTARVTCEALGRDFAIARPRLALAGLNPHAGEGGAMGREEVDILAPALETLRGEGVDIAGPMPPDTLFHAEARAKYDAAVCLYHDQGLIPVKTLNFHGGVNVTLGLPVVRTSPDHGTAFDIAGQGLARPDSLIAAIELAAAMAGNRAGAA